jgi:transcriptional regulator with XRE-family HTH domain
MDLYKEFGLDATSEEAQAAQRALAVYENTIKTLVACRIAHGLKRKQVAKRMQTRKSVVKELENLNRDVEFSTVLRYAEAVGMNLTIKLVSKSPENRK